MRSRVAVVISAAVLAGGWLFAAHGPAPRAAENCASLGEAAAFDVFSDGVYEASNTSLAGRAAAAGNVTVSAIDIGQATSETYAVVSGADITGTNGSVQGGVRYAGALHTTSFGITGARDHGAPPFSFAQEFTRLESLSAHLAAQPVTPGTSVAFDPYQPQLEFTAGGPARDLYVFSVSGDQLGQAARFLIDLPAAATAVINVTGPHVSVTGADNMTLNGITAQHVIWNFAGVSDLTLGGSVPWKGTLLAPDTDITNTSSHDLYGQLFARNARTNALTIHEAPFSGCLPAPPAAALELSALCIGAADQLWLRLRNRGASTVNGVRWEDLDSAQSGGFSAHAGQDRYFDVDASDGGPHRIVVTAGSTTLGPETTARRCTGSIMVTKRVTGAGPGGAWTIDVSDGVSVVHRGHLAADESFTTAVPGDYLAGSVPIGESPGGALYTVTEDDPRGGTATVSEYPIAITDDTHADVTVTNAFPAVTPTPTPSPTVTPSPTSTPEPPVVLPDPGQPTLPPGAPDPPPGPDLSGSAPGEPAADLDVTHTIRPRRFRVGQIVTTVTRVRNLGRRDAVGTVGRELPQTSRRAAAQVAHTRSITTSAGRCRTRRPVLCSLGTLRPGQSAVIHSTSRILVPGALPSVVHASSTTAESNTTNNTSVVVLRSLPGNARVRVRISAPAGGRVGAPFGYRVTVSARDAAVSSVRLCTRVPVSFTGTRAPGTFRYRGMRCHDYGRLATGTTRGFTVRAVPAARGAIPLSGLAAATGVAGLARDRTRALITGGVCAGAARARRPLC